MAGVCVPGLVHVCVPGLVHALAQCPVAILGDSLRQQPVWLLSLAGSCIVPVANTRKPTTLKLNCGVHDALRRTPVSRRRKPSPVGATPASSSRKSARPTQAERAQQSRAWLSPVFWRLSLLLTTLRHIMPDIPEGVQSMPALLRFRRRHMARVLQRQRAHAAGGPVRSRPHASDLEGMGRVVPRVPLPPGLPPCRFGKLNADAITAAHQRHCRACRQAISPRCYASRIIQWARYGYKPAMQYQPRPFRARRPNAADPQQTVLDDNLRGELKRREVERIRGAPPRVASSRFVVQRKKFKVGLAREVGLDSPAAFTLKNRVVQDLSQSGVNEATWPWSFRYATIDELIMDCPPGGFLASCDIKGAYKTIGLRADARHLFAFRQAEPSTHQDAWWLPSVLVFGLSPACGAFSFVSSELARTCRRTHGVKVWVYIDDLAVWHKTKQGCARHLAVVKGTAKSFGMLTEDDKDSLPAQQLVIIGFLVDTVARTISVPADKIAALRAEIGAALAARRHCPAKQLLSLAGKLGHVAPLIHGARGFIAATRSAALAGKRAHKSHVALSEWAVSELQWWLHTAFSSGFAGVRAWLQEDTESFASFCGDASGVAACAAHTATEFLHHAWTPEQASWSVPARELYWVLLGLKKFGANGRWRDSIVVVATDNVGNAFSILKGSTCPGASRRAVLLLREIFQTCHAMHCELVAMWAPRVTLSLADRLASCTDIAVARVYWARAMSDAYMSIRHAAQTFRVEH